MIGGGGSAGGAGTGTAGGARGAGGRGGAAVTYQRLTTSKKRLAFDWKHPVPISEESLDLQSVIKELRGTDPRPLFILRDCENCKGRDDAVLGRSMNNEKQLLASHWFHCIKLDRRVVEKSHPFHALFGDKKPAHVVIATWDGSQITPFDGRQTPRRLWKAMTKVLKLEYKKSADRAVRTWLRTLSRFDAIDSKLSELKRQAEATELKVGAKHKRTRALQKKIKDAERDMKLAVASEKKLMNLILRRAPKHKTAADFDAEAAKLVKPSGGSSLLDRIRKDSKKDAKPGAGKSGPDQND